MKDPDKEGIMEAWIVIIRYYKYLFGFISLATALFVIYSTYFSLTTYGNAISIKPLENPYLEFNSGYTEYWAPNEDIQEDSIELGSLSLPNSKCHLPNLKPFDESILSYVYEPSPVACPSPEMPLLFKKTFDSKLILVDNPMKYLIQNCSYQYLIRKNDSDSSVIFSDETFPITEMITEIPSAHEFIAVTCSKRNSSKIIDMFPFVPVKTNSKPYVQQKFVPSVLILGLDAISHMNFMRVMPKSYEFLNESLKANGMNGYTKIGDNTFPNIVAALMGKNESELNSCMRTENEYFDDCPFIWKNFSSAGYLTSFVEDSAWMSIFNYGKKGFNYPPTDYYTRPFSYMADKVIGSHRLMNADLCNGPRLAFEVILNYVQQTAITMKNTGHNYFQFIWATSLFHDFLNEGKLGDDMLLNVLEMLKRENCFNNTVFILMSDHGARWGDIRDTYQGKLEERMPFLYFLLPESVLNNPTYKTALKNLRENKERLTTPYDLHETLKDFLNFTSLENELITQRTKELNNNTKPRGISLFLPVPHDRDCDSAGIEEHWCVCHSMKNIPVENNLSVHQAVSHVVANINQILMDKQTRRCANLSLHKILTAQEMTVDNLVIRGDDKENASKGKSPELTLSVNFLTSPGNASFEATVKRTLVNSIFSWNILGDISRTNLYGNQSSCVQSYRFKKFCYCLQ